MRNKSIAKRYAQALIEISQERKTLDSYEKELQEVIDYIINEKNLKETWFSKELTTDDKKKVIKDFFAEKVSNIILNFLCLVIDKHRENFLVDIFMAYKAQGDILRNIQDAEVRSAVQITDKDFRILQEKLSAMTGKNIRLHAKIDPSLVGGLVIRIGDQVIDGSVIKRLAIIKNRLKNVQLSEIGVRD